MLDKSLPYYDYLMCRKAGTPIHEPEWPEGYRVVFFQLGDEKEWAEIEATVGEFDRAVDALAYFHEAYLPHHEELARRCLFVVDPAGRKVATFTTWWNYTGQRRDPWVHWVAVHPSCQGLGLGKAIICEGIKLTLAIEGDRDIYLHTQTWSYKAINIYRHAGFFHTDEKNLSTYLNDNYDIAEETVSPYLR